MDVEVLKNEKKMILERANMEKRDLTPEEKDRCHVIDKQVYDIENGFFNPSGFIKTSVKVNINAAKDDIPIPHVELKQEQHDVYVPPVGAKEVMEYDKIHQTAEVLKSEEPIYDFVNEITQAITPTVTQSQPQAPMVNQVETPVVNEQVVSHMDVNQPVVENQVVSPIYTNQQMTPNNNDSFVNPAVEVAMSSSSSANPSITIDPTPNNTTQAATKNDFFKKNKVKIILGTILALLVLFKFNHYISYEYSTNSILGSTQGIYVYGFKHNSLNSIKGIYVYDGKENMVEAVKETYEDLSGTIVISVSKTKLLIFTSLKSTDNDWYYSENTKEDVKSTCKSVNESDNGVCIMF